MPSTKETLAKRLQDANPFLRTEIIAMAATSPNAKHREALGHALAGQTNCFGARSALEHLSQDNNDDVRAAAIGAATLFPDSGASYQKILLKACLDSCVRVRQLAIAAIKKGIHRGMVKNVPHDLVQSARSPNRRTQVRALDALDALAHADPPSTAVADMTRCVDMTHSRD